MLNSFTLVHSRTLAGPQQFLLFCAFLSKQINIMINFYLYVSDNNDSNPSFHEEQLPAIAARRGSWWMFSHASQAVYKWKLSRKNNNNNNNNSNNNNNNNNSNNSKNNSNLSLLMLYLLRSISSVNRTSCVESIVFPINQSKKLNILSPLHNK